MKALTYVRRSCVIIKMEEIVETLSPWMELPAQMGHGAAVETVYMIAGLREHQVNKSYMVNLHINSNIAICSLIP